MLQATIRLQKCVILLYLMSLIGNLFDDYPLKSFKKIWLPKKVRVSIENEGTCNETLVVGSSSPSMKLHNELGDKYMSHVMGLPPKSTMENDSIQLLVD